MGDPLDQHDPTTVAAWREMLNDEGNVILDEILARGGMPALGLFVNYRKTPKTQPKPHN
jgi:hypothetical protein